MLNLGCERELRWRLSNAELSMQSEQQKYGMSIEHLEAEKRSSLTHNDPLDPLSEDLAKQIRTSGQPESPTAKATASRS
jgi:hypothetical protein